MVKKCVTDGIYDEGIQLDHQKVERTMERVVSTRKKKFKEDKACMELNLHPLQVEGRCN